jgi:hypothetical protein
MGPLHMAWIGCQVPIIMSEAAPLVVEVAAGTDLGCVRASNERQLWLRSGAADICRVRWHGGRGGPCPLKLQQGQILCIKIAGGQLRAGSRLRIPGELLDGIVAANAFSPDRQGGVLHAFLLGSSRRLKLRSDFLRRRIERRRERGSAIEEPQKGWRDLQRWAWCRDILRALPCEQGLKAVVVELPERAGFGARTALTSATGAGVEDAEENGNLLMRAVGGVERPRRRWRSQIFSMAANAT